MTWFAATARHTVETDSDQDGHPDTRNTFVSDSLVESEMDRNLDGRMDSKARFRNDVAVSDRQDNNFDGVYETIVYYDRGFWTHDESDADGDGVLDYRNQARHGVLYSSEWLNPSGNVVKRLVYDGLTSADGEIDTNGDGILDTRRRYSRLQEVIDEQPLRMTPAQ